MLVTLRSVALIEAKARRLLLNVREIGDEAELRAAVQAGLDEAAEPVATAIDAGRRSGAPSAPRLLILPAVPLAPRPVVSLG